MAILGYHQIQLQASSSVELLNFLISDYHKHHGITTKASIAHI